MSERSEAFERAWSRFRVALESGDETRSLTALQEWIIAWDECVQAGETECFGVAYHEDLEAIVRLPVMLGTHDTQGLDAFRREVEDTADIASRFRFDVTEFDRHGDRFMGSGRFRARGRYSGIVMRFPVAVVWTYRDGRISRVQAFGSRRQARAELLAGRAAATPS